MCCSHTADTSAFDLDGWKPEKKTKKKTSVRRAFDPQPIFFFWTCWSESRLEISAQRSLSTSKMAALPGWSPHNLSSNTPLRCCSQPPPRALTDTPALHLSRLSPSPSPTGPSLAPPNNSHRARMRNSAWCVCVIVTSVRWGVPTVKGGGSGDKGMREGRIAGLRIHRIMKQHLCVKKTDQARASRGCRTSPAPAARGPRSSLRWCRCGRWSGTAATPTPAPSAAPHSGGTRRRSRPRNRLRWPGRPPRPRIKAPTATVSFWRVLVSLSPVCLSVCLCARKPYLCAAASLQAINICPCAALARSPSIRVWCAAVPERRLPPPSSSAEEQHVRPRPSK